MVDMNFDIDSGENLFSSTDKDHTCLGTGLIALDAVLEEGSRSQPILSLGGSCGNVLTILAYLGWRSIPIGRLKKDPAADFIIREFEKWKVDTSFVQLDDLGSTPIIIERLVNRGRVDHRYEWRCPQCGRRFPSYTPIPRRSVREFIADIPKAEVFYFDRPSSAALELAMTAKSLGALLFFEPQSQAYSGLFQRAVAISDIVKYSRHRLIEIPTERRDLFEIQTLGADGLRYRFHSKNWRLLPPEPAVLVKDTAGAGDWSSAGIIHYLAVNGCLELRSVKPRRLQEALRFGQVIAGLNCRFIGARGGMELLSKSQFGRVVRRLWSQRGPVAEIPPTLSRGSWEQFHLICAGCRREG